MKTSERVARQLVQSIVDQDLQPGDVLPSEAAMLADLGVGRAALREALRILEVSGLVRLRPGPGGGPVIGDVDGAGMARMLTLFLQVSGVTVGELLQARLDLEPWMAGLAARNATREDAERLKATHGNITAIDLTDDAAYTRAASTFHTCICDISGNRPLAMMTRALMGVFTSRADGEVYPAKERERVVAEHARIAAAIAAGNERKAQDLMRAHLTHYVESVHRRYPALIDRIIDWG